MTTLHCCVMHMPRAAPSIYFGCAGELWNASGRLTNDWSFAGFANGDSPIPNVPIVGNVKDYGAKGDNITDDTAAFLKALADPKVRYRSSIPAQPTTTVCGEYNQV